MLLNYVSEEKNKMNMYTKILNDAQLTKNFKISEMECHCGCESVILHPDGILLLQKIRDEFKKPIEVCSNYRCYSHNINIGGSPVSFHLQGMAWDIKVQGVDPLTVGRYAKDIGFHGVGVYTHNGQRFTHVDIREKPVYWLDGVGLNNLIRVTGL